MHLLVAAPARAWNVFLACENWKKSWTFWDAYMSLTWCSNMVQTQMKETGYSSSFTSLFWLVWLPPLSESVFFRYVSGFGSKFSRIALLRKRLQLDSKSDLTTDGLILGFFVGKWLLLLTSYLYGPKSAGIAHLLILFDGIKFFRFLVWGVFWSVL